VVADAERVAKTESFFRDVNERIAESAERFGAEEAEFVCECHDAGCTHRVESTLEQYEEVRSDPTHFLLVDGHEADDIERVVARRRGGVVVEKFGRVVTRLVRQMNPRVEPV
jgi:hypothetical protein